MLKTLIFFVAVTVAFQDKLFVHGQKRRGQYCMNIENEIELANGLILTQNRLGNSDQVQMQLTYEGQGWLSFGFSKDGSMVGSTVIVGFPDESTNPGTYYLGDKAASGIQDAPSVSPSNSPTESPTNAPTTSPSSIPTTSPSNAPSKFPSNAPSQEPTKSPVVKIEVVVTPPPPPVKPIDLSFSGPGWRRVLMSDPEGSNTMMGVSGTLIFQNDTHTVLEFIRPMYYDRDMMNKKEEYGLNKFIYAAGSSNQFESHPLYGSYKITFGSCSSGRMPRFSNFFSFLRRMKLLSN